MITRHDIIIDLYDWKANKMGGDALMDAIDRYTTNCQNEAVKEAAKEIMKIYDEYVALLGDELSEVVSMMAVHGWKSTRFEQGVIDRGKIEQLKERLLK